MGGQELPLGLIAPEAGKAGGNLVGPQMFCGAHCGKRAASSSKGRAVFERTCLRLGEYEAERLGYVVQTSAGSRLRGLRTRHIHLTIARMTDNRSLPAHVCAPFHMKQRLKPFDCGNVTGAYSKNLRFE